MGTWGTAIFSDDTASDVRGDFRDLIGDGLSPEDATERMLAQYASIVDDPEGGTSFWLGLAVTQWQCGRLQESVKARALQIIDSGADLQRWSEDTRLAEARQAILAKTRAQLVSPQPAAKRIPKRFKESNDWEVGELISYRMGSGKHLVFRVVGHYIDNGGKRARVELLDYYDDTAPTLEQARSLPPRILVKKEEYGYTPYRRFMLCATSERQIPRKRLARLGLDGPAPDLGKDPTHVLGMLWPKADRFFEGKMSQPITWRLGPGGDDHQHWEMGDVLAYQTDSGGYLLLHFVGRHQGHAIDGAPLVVQLDWQEKSPPSAEATGAGGLVPRRSFAADDPLLKAAGVVSPCVGFVLVHSADDGVDGSALRRIGNFPCRYDLGYQGFQGFPFASVPMIAKRFERHLRMRAQRG